MVLLIEAGSRLALLIVFMGLGAEGVGRVRVENSRTWNRGAGMRLEDGSATSLPRDLGPDLRLVPSTLVSISKSISLPERSGGRNDTRVGPARGSFPHAAAAAASATRDPSAGDSTHISGTWTSSSGATWDIQKDGPSAC